jgi:hypothetical protein
LNASMLKQWHRDDIFAALERRGWSKPIKIHVLPDWYAVGEAWTASRLEETLKILFVADYGTGYKGIDSVESLTASVKGKAHEYCLWLNRTRDSLWKAAVLEWANSINPDQIT